MAPYANSMGATPASLTSIAIYLSNTKHAHHEDYELTPIQVLGVRSVQEFIDYAKASFNANKKKVKAGRPPKNGGSWIIVRTPEGTFLDTHEMAAYERAAMQAAGLGGPVVGILNWHRNHFSGSDDLNLLSAAFTTEGNSVRDRDTHTIKNLRWVMDQVTDELNVLRREKGVAPILTMKAIKRERAQQRGEQDVVEELARLPCRTEDLEPALLSLGYEVTRFNPKNDFVSFIPPGKKKAKEVSGFFAPRRGKCLFSEAERAPEIAGASRGRYPSQAIRARNARSEVQSPAEEADRTDRTGARRSLAPELESSQKEARYHPNQKWHDERRSHLHHERVVENSTLATPQGKSTLGKAGGGCPHGLPRNFLGMGIGWECGRKLDPYHPPGKLTLGKTGGSCPHGPPRNFLGLGIG